MAEKQDDSLLQDASTLLMFANAAAKQSQEKPPAAAPSPAHISPPTAHISPPMASPPVPSLPPLSSLGGASLSQYHFPKPKAFESLAPLQFNHLPHLSQLPLFKPGDAVLGPSLVHERPREPQTAPASSRHSSSSSSSDAPKSHKRTRSEADKDQSSRSPGPASVVLARGIDPATGRPNNSNSVIAAAALAQAADNPLPPFKREPPVPVVDPALVPVPVVEPAQAARPREIAPKPRSQEPTPVLKREPTPKPEPVKAEPKEEPAPFVAPPLSAYQVDPDSGIIGCICGLEDDDGFTIQCDVCFRWQHCLCMGFTTNEEVPEDEYRCYYCDNQKWGKFDPEECRLSTLARLEEESTSKKDKKKRKSVSNDGDRKRKKPDTDRTKEKKKPQKEEPEAPGTPPEDPEPEFIPNTDNELLEEGVSAENYQATYYKLRSNDYRTHDLQKHFQELGSAFYEKYQALDEQAKKDVAVEVVSRQQFRNIPLMPITLPNLIKYKEKHQQPVSTPDISVRVKPYSDTQKQRFNGISKLGLFLELEVPEKDPAEGDKDAQPQEFTIAKGTPIIEYFGVIDLFSTYRDDLSNKYATLGTTKPRVLKTKLSLIDQDVDIVLDSRFVGSESRFIRKSCSPSANCEIKQYYIPETSSFRFLVYTTKDIVLGGDSPEEELRLPWEWHPDHPIKKLLSDEEKGIEGVKFDQLPEKEKALLVTGIDNLLYFTECGCNTTSNTPSYLPQCGLFKVKKAISYLLRSTRKASSISNVNLYKPREELIVPKKPKQYVSWQDRLHDRDRVIQAHLYLTAQDSDEKVDEACAEVADITKEVLLPLKHRILQQSRLVNTTLEEPKVEVKINQIIPLTQEVQMKIKKEVGNQVQVAPEVQKTLSEIEQKLAVKNEPHEIAVPNVETPPAGSEAVAPVKPVKAEDPQPIVKKKLSFADYKKKMK